MSWEPTGSAPGWDSMVLADTQGTDTADRKGLWDLGFITKFEVLWTS